MHAGLLRCMLSCFLRTEAAKQLKNCNQSFKIRETGLVLIQRQSACHGLCTGVWTCFELSKLFPPPARISKKPPHFEPWNPKQLFSVSMAEKPTPLERKPLIIKKKKKTDRQNVFELRGCVCTCLVLRPGSGALGTVPLPLHEKEATQVLLFPFFK